VVACFWVRYSLTRSKKAVIGGGIGIAGTLCFLSMGAGFCAATLHVPTSTSVLPPNAVDVSVAARDQAKLVAWWLRPPKPYTVCVIVLHGIKDSRRNSVVFAPMFLAHDYAVLVPDSRGHGESGGAILTYGLLEKYDVIDWTHWMRSQGCQKIYGLGESLGASILIQAAAVETSFSAIVAECAYADLREIAEYRMREVLPLPSFVAVPIAKLIVFSGMVYADVAYGLDLREVSPVKSIARTQTPIMLIHGLNDVRTPPSHSRQLAAADSGASLWLVPNTGHISASVAEPDQFRERVLSWFAQH
jgi:pimeloyl-ACP methyl ester carboxylesterase